MLMDEERVEVTIPPRQSFTREQKFGYAVVIGCGVFAVLLGGFYMVKHIKQPFIISYTGSRFVTGEQAAAAEVAQQKAADTDGDTISDYDELNIFETSPYLTDTDSDGRTDDFEIANNMDPACATGAACENESDEINANANPIGAEAASAAAKDAAAAEAQLAQLKALLDGQSSTDVRAMLIDGGADPATVNAMTDDEVMALYTEVLKELEGNGGLDALLTQVQDAAADGEDATTATPTTTP